MGISFGINCLLTILFHVIEGDSFIAYYPLNAVAPPERLISWAAEVGPNTRDLVRIILAKAAHPQQKYNSCQGIIRLKNRYGTERLELAAKRAVVCNAANYKSVKSILDKGLDKEPIREAPRYVPADHENIRGSDYYN